MIYAGSILLLAVLGYLGAGQLSLDTFSIMLALSIATNGICQAISKLKDNPNDKEDKNDKKE